MAFLRIPILVALLVVSGPLQADYARSRFSLTLDAATAAIPTWLALVALAVAFVVAATARRGQRHATTALVLELVLAVVIALVPPLIWLQVAPGPWNEAMGGTSGATYSQVLAIVWGMVAVRTLRTQRRAA